MDGRDAPRDTLGKMITEDLIRRILIGYRLPQDGIHGVAHWARVLETGLLLAKTTGANPQVIRLFAVFHDGRRKNEGWDPDHGRRGGDFAASLLGTGFDLSAEEFRLLYDACVYHTDGLIHGNATIQTCWDADRLDLGRVGIVPKLKYLGTEAARDPQNIRWADERGRSRFVPDWIWEHLPPGEKGKRTS